MNIYFVRHGDAIKEKCLNADGVADGALTEIGKEQAHSTGELLRTIPFERIYSSDLKRAVETAEIISSYQQGLDVQQDKRIREIHMGVFHTSNEDQIKKEHPEFFKAFTDKNSDFKYPGGESGEEVLRRSLSFIEPLYETSFENICVVCHGGVIRSLFSHFLGLPQHKRFSLNPANGGVSILRVENQIPKIISINEISHLKKYETY